MYIVNIEKDFLKIKFVTPFFILFSNYTFSTQEMWILITLIEKKIAIVLHIHMLHNLLYY